MHSFEDGALKKNLSYWRASSERVLWYGSRVIFFFDLALLGPRRIAIWVSRVSIKEDSLQRSLGRMYEQSMNVCDPGVAVSLDL